MAPPDLPIGEIMLFVVQATFPGRRRNSPRADSLCSNIDRLTVLPPALFIADEAAITVSVDGGAPIRVRALIGVGSDDQFSTDIFLAAHVPGLGLVERCHIMKFDTDTTVGEAVDQCVLMFASSLANRVIDSNINADIQVIGHTTETLVTSRF